MIKLFLLLDENQMLVARCALKGPRLWIKVTLWRAGWRDSSMYIRVLNDPVELGNS